MTIALLWIVIFLGVFGLIFAPRFMVLLTWPVVLWYPQKLLYNALPWNAGLDDLFLLLVALRMLLYFRQDGVAPLATGAFLLSIAMILVEIIANFTGTLRYSFLTPYAMKSVLKGGVVASFVLLLLLDIRNSDDVRRHLIAFSVALSVAFVLVPVCLYSLTAAHYWQKEREGTAEYNTVTVEKRAHGPFVGPNGVGNMACVAIPVALGLLTQKPRRRLIAVVSVMLLISAVAALLVAKSRSGILGLAVMFALMAIFSQKRGYIIAIECAVILGMTAFLAGGKVLATTEERFNKAEFREDLGTRIRIWTTTLHQPSPWIAFCGEGTLANHVRIGIGPHNGYLEALYVWGVGGVLAFCLLIRKALTWASITARFDPVSYCRGLAWGFRWSFVAVGVMAMSSGPWDRQPYRLMVYFFLAIVGSRYLVLRHEPSIRGAVETAGNRIHRQQRTFLPDGSRAYP